MRALVLTVLVTAGCLGQYNAPPDPPASPPAKTQPAPSGPAQSPTPTPTPTPSPSPPQTPTPPNDLAMAPTPTSDGGTSTACAQLTDCCQQDQTCLDQVAGLGEQVCQGILDQLQQQGLCL